MRSSSKCSPETPTCSLTMSRMCRSAVINLKMGRMPVTTIAFGVGSMPASVRAQGAPR